MDSFARNPKETMVMQIKLKLNEIQELNELSKQY